MASSVNEPHRRPLITILLLNYRRPQNIPLILNSIESQTLKARVFLWNSGDSDVNSPRIDLYRQSGANVGCMARWTLAQEATTPYVMTLDDDVCLNGSDALEKVVRSLDRYADAGRILGFVGASFSVDLKYNIREEVMCRYRDTTGRLVEHMQSDHLFNSAGERVFIKRAFVDRDEPVDMVKGRMMALETSLVADLALPDEREDDIFINATLARGGRGFHRIPKLLDDAVRELPEHGAGNWMQPGHFESRQRAIRSYFLPL
jgi:GT2 family glycosyltransferase